MESTPQVKSARLEGLKRLFLAGLAGLLLTCAFPKTGFDLLVWAALSPMLIAVMDLSGWQRFRFGLFTGMAHYLSLMYWVIHAMHIYGHIPIYLCIPILILFALYLSLYFGVFAALLPLICTRPLLGVFAAPALWVALEYLRSRLFTGFPWGLLGHTQFERIAIIQSADVFGVYGLSWLIVMANSVLALLYIYLTKRQMHGKMLNLRTIVAASGIWIMLLISVIGYGHYRMATVDGALEKLPSLKATVVQGNIDQAIKWNVEFRDDTTLKYIRLTLSAKEQQPDLVIWPETATPFYFMHDSPTHWVLRCVKDIGAAFVIGSPAYVETNGQYSYYNSAFLIDENGEFIGRYDKAHLVPFGEYVPLRKYLPFIKKLVAQVGEFSRGEIGATHQLQGVQLGVLICYELIFPYISRAAVNHDAELLINITNDAWYGLTSGPYQHFAQAVFRAVESKRYLVRSANTGISGVIDPLGRITRQSELFQEDVFTQPVKRFQHKTVYHRFGDVFAQANGVLILLLIVIIFYQRRSYVLRTKTNR